MSEQRPKVRGVDLDGETRCRHWHSALDIIAIRMKCCGEYYACSSCHDELAGHAAKVWPREEWNEKAILCGRCNTELSIQAYMDSGDACPACKSCFNPGCRKHYHHYFEGN